jgi:hypothetical protein
VQIDAPLEFAGGFLYLDGMMVGELAKLEGYSERGAVIELFGLSPGDHELAVDNGRSASLRKHFRYEPSAVWPMRDQITIDLAEVTEKGAA